MLYWLSLTLLFLGIQAFYSMLEMASVSFDKVRIHYYVNKGNKQAKWLSFLLEKPGRLFGTTLIAVNFSLQIGSECSRQLYTHLGLTPNLAPLTQILLVLIFAELAPMVAARRYNENVVMLGIPIIYFTSRLLSPVIWLVNGIAKTVNAIFSKNKSNETAFFLSRDDLQKVFEEDSFSYKEGAFNRVLSNIFKLREKTALQIMEPLNTLQLVPSNCTVGYLREILKHSLSPFIPLFHGSRSNIIGIVLARDLLTLPETFKVRESIKQPWFLSQNTPIVDILQQFKKNQQRMAIVLNQSGQSIGLISLKDILEEIFDEKSLDLLPILQTKLIEKQINPNMKLSEFNKCFHTNFDDKKFATINLLLEKTLERPPEEGDTILIDKFEFKILQANLRGAKLISIRTIID